MKNAWDSNKKGDLSPIPLFLYDIKPCHISQNSNNLLYVSDRTNGNARRKIWRYAEIMRNILCRFISCRQIAQLLFMQERPSLICLLHVNPQPLTEIPLWISVSVGNFQIFIYCLRIWVILPKDAKQDGICLEIINQCPFNLPLTLK